jgi:hypothetical protein
MNTHLKFASRSFPARVADLGFSAELPADWISHDLPREDVDFGNPANFMPLAVVTAPHAAIVFAFAARPAYDDGALHDWAWHLLSHNQLQPRATGPAEVAGVPAVTGEAVQQSDLGPMIVRFAFLEDGNRLLNLTLTAPELLADSVRDAWFTMLQSFSLETPRGSRFSTPRAATVAPVMNDPAPRGLPLPEDPEPDGSEQRSTDAKPSLSVPELAIHVPEGLQPKKSKLYDYALSADSASLDEANAVNKSLRERGVGLVPKLAGQSPEARRATLAAGAIMARIDVPYGWHVIDDGKRTLVFEPSGKVQINLNLIPRHERSEDAILDDIEAQMGRDYPRPEFLRVTQGRIHALGARNIADGEEPVEQYHMLYPFRDGSMVLRARVTATPDQATDACNLAELILESAVFVPVPSGAETNSRAQDPGGSPGGENEIPRWWREALALEAEGRLADAEKRIHDNCASMGYAYSTAEMYRRRMLRMKGAGDQAAALDAFRRSNEFIWHYASMATSGGEGAALSRERDQFRARLVSEYGCDPEAGA